jgi:hypothetical protein
MRQYAGPDESFSYPDQTLARTTVIRVPIERMTGKKSGYP